MKKLFIVSTLIVLSGMAIPKTFANQTNMDMSTPVMFPLVTVIQQPTPTPAPNNTNTVDLRDRRTDSPRLLRSPNR